MRSDSRGLKSLPQPPPARRRSGTHLAARKRGGGVRIRGRRRGGRAGSAGETSETAEGAQDRVGTAGRGRRRGRAWRHGWRGERERPAALERQGQVALHRRDVQAAEHVQIQRLDVRRLHEAARGAHLQITQSLQDRYATVHTSVPQGSDTRPLRLHSLRPPAA